VNPNIKYLIADIQPAVVGEERAAYQVPYRSALRAGVTVTSASDAPNVPADWRQGVATALLREGRSGVVSGPGERIGLRDALHTEYDGGGLAGRHGPVEGLAGARHGGRRVRARRPAPRRTWPTRRRPARDPVPSGLAEMINPGVQGWMHYYGRFYRSALSTLLARINSYLVRWLRLEVSTAPRTPTGAGGVGAPDRAIPRFLAHWARVRNPLMTARTARTE
jgi:hypothetical protein